MPDKLRSVDPLLPLKPKVLHILLAVADGPRHGYSIMQEVAGAHGRPGAPLARGVVRIASGARKDRFDCRVGQAAGRRRRRRAAPLLCAHAARQARAGCRGAAPRSDCPSRPLEPCVAKGRTAHDDRSLCVVRPELRQLLRVLRVRDRRSGMPSAKTANACSKRLARVGASRSRRRGSRCSGISSSSAPGTISHRHCGRWFDRRQSRSAFHSSSGLASRRRPRSSRLLTRCCFGRFPTINRIGSS